MRSLRMIGIIYAIIILYTSLCYSFKSISSNYNKLQSNYNKYLLKSLKSTNDRWISTISTNPSAFDAVDEVISSISTIINQQSNIKEYVLLFFISSGYEMTSFNYDYIFDQLDIINNNNIIKNIIGCTTSTAIGSKLNEKIPFESESRPAFSSLLIPVDGINAYSYSLSEEELINKQFNILNDNDSINILFGTDNIKDLITNILTNVKSNDNIKVFGSFASSVTSLQAPKLFHKTSDSSLKKLTHGLVGLSISGDIEVHNVVSHSSIPVGPMYRVLETNKNEMLLVENTEAIIDSIKPPIASPLVQLCDILETLPEEQSFKLKEQLLISIVTSSPEEIKSNGYKNLFESSEYFTQKPLNFDQISGSITLSHVPNINSTFQFCVRDTTLARKDFRRVISDIKTLINSPDIGQPLSILMFGSNERGNKIFRYNGWESSQLSYLLDTSDYENQAVISGLYSNGVFANLKTLDHKTIPAIMEGNSLYSVFTKKSINKTLKSDKKSINYIINYNIESEDIMTLDEMIQFDDINDIVLVRKKDTDSSHAVRVATMDFTVPEKAPQPKNILESIVWEREKEVDRLRERFQLSRALLQVKAATTKFQSIDFIQVIKSHSLIHSSSVIVELTKDSLYNGKLKYKDYIPTTSELIDHLSIIPNIVSLSVNVDTAVYDGDYKDIEIIKSKTNYPIICNDFIVYAYQIFQAKTSGADVIKLMASVLPIQELNYLIKIAKAFNMLCIVVISSKSQLLQVLANIPDIQMISITSRNQRIWKIQPGKAQAILTDLEVKEAIVVKKSNDPNFLIFQEGLISKQDISESKSLGVDAVILGEELLDGLSDITYDNKIKQWINN